MCASRSVPFIISRRTRSCAILDKQTSCPQVFRMFSRWKRQDCQILELCKGRGGADYCQLRYHDFHVLGDPSGPFYAAQALMHGASSCPPAKGCFQHIELLRSLQHKFGTIPSVHAIGGVLASIWSARDLERNNNNQTRRVASSLKSCSDCERRSKLARPRHAPPCPAMPRHSIVFLLSLNLLQLVQGKAIDSGQG